MAEKPTARRARSCIAAMMYTGGGRMNIFERIAQDRPGTFTILPGTLP